MNQPYLSRIALRGYRHLLAAEPGGRRRLLDFYETQESNPHAQEIAAWLRGEYAFDPQCLTT
jgi:hypothetical protein